MTDENMTKETAVEQVTVDENAEGKKPSNRSADARTRRARRVFAVIMIILLLLLCGVTALFVRAVAPVGAPEDKVSSEGLEWVRSIYGYGEAEADQLANPNDIGIAGDGTIWVSDTGHSRVVGFNPDGSYRSLIHQGPAFSNPRAIQSAGGVTTDEDGNVWLCDNGRQKVAVYNSDNELIREFDVPLPTNIAVRDGRVVVGSYSGFAILNEEGDVIKVVGSHGKGEDQFDNVQGVAIDDDGNIFVMDSHNNRLSSYDRTGKKRWTRRLGEPSNTALGNTKKASDKAEKSKYSVQLPTGLTIDGNNRLVFVDPFEFAIVVADPKDGKIIAKYGEDGTADGKFAYPTGIDYDRDRDWFVVADTSNDRAQIVRIPDSGGGPIAAFRRLTTGWLKICGIPLLLILVAIITTALMRRRKNVKKDETKGEGEDEQGGPEAVSTPLDEVLDPS